MAERRLGVIFHPAFASDSLPDYARRAEAGGIDELWLWDDCFLPGAFTSAATALAATSRLKVGIGLLPVKAYNPLFATMEITTLACIYPGRFIAGFGHGVDGWMKQIGAPAGSSMKAIDETVNAVCRLLSGESVTVQGDYVHLDNVKMTTYPSVQPPLYVGGMREKTLRLAGRIGDGTILTGMSSPAYVRWAKSQVEAGQAEAGQKNNAIAVYVFGKVNPDGQAARAAVRRVIAAQFEWAGALLTPLGIADEAQALSRQYGVKGAAERMPEQWVDDLSVSGTPEQAQATVHRLYEAGADSVILQPLDNDPGCLDEYIRYLVPLLKG